MIVSVLLAPPIAAFGQEAAPTESAMLTIVGKVTGGKVTMTAAEIDALPRVEIVTTTPWFDGSHRFSGPLLSSILNAAGANGTELRVVSINGYSVPVPVSDATDYGLILARRMDEEELTVRNKGPLFLVYPFDTHAEIRNDIYIDRSVWYVNEIEVR